MIPQINILTVVDVIGALSAGTLTNNLYMMDNRRGSRTSGLGTGTLSSDVTYTQVLNWHVIPVDFQTDIQIRKIAFYRNGVPVARANTPCARLQKYGAPSGQYWAGVINYQSQIEGGVYQYLIEFDMGNRVMTMENFATININAAY
jgi:hypothetical protein